MILPKSLKNIAAAVGLAVLCGCSNHVVPITNFDNQPWPVSTQRLTAGDLTQRVERGAAAAGWQATETGPGQMQAVFVKHEHIVTVRIAFNQTAYSIDYVSSSNMNEQPGKVHPRYREWVETLKAAILNEVGRAG